MAASTIGGINRLPEAEKRAIYTRYVPAELIQRFGLPDLTSDEARPLLRFKYATGTSDVEISLFHQQGFPDPILYAHLADTLNGQIHILLYILNNPDSPRFDVDRMPDGTPTKFGTFLRNVEAEKAALEAGLAPGQVRRGLRFLGQAIPAFEEFSSTLGHTMFFIEPLYYHNAVIFERYGFAYQKGRRRMEAIHAGFQPGGDLAEKLNGSSDFRMPEAANSVRLRSWAIHDGLLGEPYQDVTMYKRVGVSAGIDTTPGCEW